MKATLEERLTPELELLSRWVARQIIRNGQGDSCPSPLYEESQEMLQAAGIYVGWNDERKRVQITRLEAKHLVSSVPQGDTE